MPYINGCLILFLYFYFYAITVNCVQLKKNTSNKQYLALIILHPFFFSSTFTHNYMGLVTLVRCLNRILFLTPIFLLIIFFSTLISIATLTISSPQNITEPSKPIIPNFCYNHLLFCFDTYRIIF